METLEPILSKHPFFADLDKHYLELLTGCASNVVFHEGDYLFREGDEAPQFFVLRHGRVTVETVVPGRGPIPIYTHEAGDIVGWSWLFSPYHWHFSCRAAQLTRAIALDGVCLRTKCEQDHTLGYEFMKRFVQKAVNSLELTQRQMLDVHNAHPAR